MQLLALDVINGVPAHPLVVHIPVVMIPLALALTVLAFWKRVRTSALWCATGSAAIGLVGAALAGGTGEALQNAVERTKLLREHTQAGEAVAPVAAVLLAALVVALLAHLSASDSVPFVGSLPIAKKMGAGALTAVLVLSSVIGVAATWVTYDAGHTGAKSAWRNVDLTKVHENEGHGDDD